MKYQVLINLKGENNWQLEKHHKNDGQQEREAGQASAVL
ncbi:hypothetical protein JOD28_000226 [Leuconostoc rapi]|nr:hypothetical protein [Leuconostoc rapi]